MTADDLPAVAAMNADPEVMRFFPACLTLSESAEFMQRVDMAFEHHGMGWLGATRRDTGEFVGCVGLWRPTFEASFTPCVEVGWRLCRRAWGLGMATEAARAVLAWGFSELSLEGVVSFTYEGNAPSLRVMEKLGMTQDPSANFEHPRLPVGHWLRPHVLYRLDRDAFVTARGVE